MKKRLLALATTGLMSFGLLAGGTYALFTSSATNSNNTFAAGTINLDQSRDSGDSVPGPMFYSSTNPVTNPAGLYPYDQPAPSGSVIGGEAIGGWAPGDKVTRALNLQNTGSLVARITKLQAKVNSAGVTSGAAYTEFINDMNIKVVYNTGTGVVLYNGPLSNLLNGWVTIPTMLAAGHSGPLNVSFEATLDPSADNTVEGQNFVFDFSFYAEQN
ncbi:MAG: TasA family protein [Desulfosporosinus sp.]|nr:TasA family protein [Desulfosporosinus sp.]